MQQLNKKRLFIERNYIRKVILYWKTDFCLSLLYHPHTYRSSYGRGLPVQLVTQMMCTSSGPHSTTFFLYRLWLSIKLADLLHYCLGMFSNKNQSIWNGYVFKPVQPYPPSHTTTTITQFL